MSSTAPRGDPLPRAFGNYLLIHRLAHGGMGNVFLAKSGGVAGIEKTCVVKMLRARFSADPEYVARFVEEARIVVQLTHRNICGVFDVGRVGETYYLAMELVVGRDLRSLTQALAAEGASLSTACALFAISEVLDALDYAHRHVDPVTAEPLHLVHRDVSPQNVIVNAEGEVKLIDFGLASSRALPEVSASSSAAPSIMGKLAYMAPEHARGDAVDGRADQFSAAVLLLELLSGGRYYGGLEHREVWFLAGSGSFRSALLDTVDAPLRALIERALAADREQRFGTCADFRDALSEYARAAGLHAGSRELRAVAASQSKAAMHEIREHLRQQAGVSAVARPGFAAAGTGDIFEFSTTGLEAKSSSADSASDRPDATTVVARRAGIDVVPPTITATAEEPSPPRPVRPTALLVALVTGGAVVVVIMATIVVLARSPSPSPPLAPAAAPQASLTRPALPGPQAAPLTTHPVSADAAAIAPVAVADAGSVSARPMASGIQPGELGARGELGGAVSPIKVRPRHERRDKPATAAPKAKPVTLPDRLAALSACAAREACAARLPAQRSAIATMSAAELQAFTAAVDACLAKCP